MSLDKYIPEGHIPHSKSCTELYAQVMKEMALPVPSVRTLSFPIFDEMTGGLRAREFSILCGATGVGKTTLLANFSATLIQQEIPHFVASVETGPTDFIRRLISVYWGKNLNTGRAVDLEQLKKIHILHGGKLQVSSLHLSLYEDRIPVEILLADIGWHVKNHGCKVVMLDNLNFFMEVTSAQNQIVEMDRVIHEIIVFCKQVDVHVILVMHPKKTEHGRVENEFDIKGSSTAVQESHNVFLFNRPHPDLIRAGTADAEDREIKIAKNRRFGEYIGRRLILNNISGTSYFEKVLV